MSWTVPLSEIPMPEQDVAAVVECLEGGWLTMGPRTERFEAALAAYVGCRHAVAVASGTAALHLSLLALGIGPGDEVIVPALTFVASAGAVRYTGADPVLCDVEGTHDFNLDPDDVAARVGERTKAVVAVHFAGYASAVERLRELCDARGLALVEDCAQAIGAELEAGGRTGTVGAAGCFSFFSKKQLCVGEGGAVVTDDEQLAGSARSLRSHAMTTVTWDRHRGHADSYDVTDVGFNYRIDEPRAALGLSRLARLDDEIGARRRVAHGYRERLADVDGVELPWDDAAARRASHFGFPVVLGSRRERDGVRAELERRGIQTTWYPAIHRFTDLRALFPGLSLPNAEAVAERHCMLPMASTLGEDALDAVAEGVRAALVGPR